MCTELPNEEEEEEGGMNPQQQEDMEGVLSCLTRQFVRRLTWGEKGGGGQKKGRWIRR